MDASPTAITRRGALAVGAGTVIGGLGLAGTANAAVTSTPARLSPQQLAGQRVIFSYAGLTPPASLLEQISAGLAGGVIFFGANITSLEQIAAVGAQLKEAHAGQPGALAAAADDRPGRRPRAPAARRAGPVGKAGRRVRRPARGGRRRGHRRGREPGPGRHEPQPRPRPRRLPSGRQLRRRVRPLLQHGPRRLRRVRRRLRPRAAAPRHRRDRQALPGSRRGHRHPEHRPRPGHARRAAGRPAPHRRTAVPARHRSGGPAGHDLLGGLPGARPETPGRAVARHHRRRTAADGSGSAA